MRTILISRSYIQHPAQIGKSTLYYFIIIYINSNISTLLLKDN